MMNLQFKVVLTKQLIGCLPCANQTLVLHLNEEVDHLDDDDDDDSDGDYNVGVDGVDGVDDHDPGSLCIPCTD